MKTVLLTSNSLRHKYIARCLYEKAGLKLVISEEKSPSINNDSGLSVEEQKFQREHFRARDQAEQYYFGQSDFPSNIPHIHLKHKEVNSEMILNKLSEMAPDFIVLFGTSIIQDKLLDLFPGSFINLHLGLSPWYKGSATNLFPLVDRNPQFVGATIHLATSQVDGGAIIHQSRPELSGEEDLHDIGNKVIEKSGKILPEILKLYDSHKISPIEQGASGKICRINDLSIGKLRRAYKNIENGMILDYLRVKNEIDSEFPIISNLSK